MTSIASPSYNFAEGSSSLSQYPHHSSIDAEIKNLLASACTVIEQTPPPTLREVLGAYKTKGDGDRDMLLAMLNAKSAEDQRLASVAALHRSMLEVYRNPVSQMYPQPESVHYHHPSQPFPQSHHLQEQQKPSRQVRRRDRSPPPSSGPSQPEASVSSQGPRKRHRSSQSSSSSRPSPHESLPSPHHEHLPPSPYSSAGSDSAGYSPRSRASMAIGSLLSAGPHKDVSPEDAQNPNGHVSSERSRPQNHPPATAT